MVLQPAAGVRPDMTMTGRFERIREDLMREGHPHVSAGPAVIVSRSQELLDAIHRAVPAHKRSDFVCTVALTVAPNQPELDAVARELALVTPNAQSP